MRQTLTGKPYSTNIYGTDNINIMEQGFPDSSAGKKNLPAMRETWIQSLGWEDPLEEDVATYSSILAWRIPMERGAWWAVVHWVAKIWT